jgi:hypothetical protein
VLVGAGGCQAEDGMPGCFGGKGSFRVPWAGVEVGPGDRNRLRILAQHRPGRVRADFLSLQSFPAAAAAQFNHRSGPYVPDPGHSAIRGDQPAATAALDEGYRVHLHPAGPAACRGRLPPAALAPNVLQLLLGVSAITTLFLLTLYTQQVLGYTPLQAGAAYLPLAAGVAAATAVAQRLVGRTGPRPLAIAGLATAAVGMALMGHAQAVARHSAHSGRPAPHGQPREKADTPHARRRLCRARRNDRDPHPEPPRAERARPL